MVQTAFARLAVLKCISLGPLQCSEAHVVGNVCVSRELHLKRELLITPGILESNSGSHLTKYFPCSRLSIIIIFFSIRYFLHLRSVFFLTYRCFALLSSNKNSESHGVVTAS